MTERNILINRAPVLTVGATIVAERLGFDQDEALSLGRAVAGLTAQSIGPTLHRSILASIRRTTSVFVRRLGVPYNPVAR